MRRHLDFLIQSIMHRDVSRPPIYAEPLNGYEQTAEKIQTNEQAIEAIQASEQNENRMNAILQQLKVNERMMHRQQNFLLGQFFVGIGQTAEILTLDEIALTCTNSIAADSNDHLYPTGVKNDCTHHPGLYIWAESVMGRKIRFLDLGCAGGGLVFDFKARGHLAIGIEGSDFAKRHGLGFWPVLEKNLFTGDICFNFSFKLNQCSLEFDLITAWEVLEHLEEDRIDGLLRNLVRNLKQGGFFLASVASFECVDASSGAPLHRNFHDRAWWVEKFEDHGFSQTNVVPFSAFARGVGNPTADDWNVIANPNLGFHLAFIKDLPTN